MTYIETIGRVTLLFISLWAMTRLLGKKQISQLTMFDYITGITIGSMAATAIGSPDYMYHLLLAMGLWTIYSYGLHWVDLKSRRARQFLDGKPTILIQHGQLLEANLQQAELSLDHVMARLRDKGYFNLSEVEFATLETDGKLSVLPKSQYRPIRPADLKLSTTYEGLPTQLIQDGLIQHEHLELLGLTADWLRAELKKRGYDDPGRQVFGAWLGTDGTLTIDPYDDRRPGPEEMSQAHRH